MRRALAIFCVMLPAIARAQANEPWEPSPSAPPPSTASPSTSAPSASPSAPSPSALPSPSSAPSSPPQPAPAQQPVTPPALPVAPPPRPAPTVRLVPANMDTPGAIERRHAAEALCAARDPKCDWIATFSTLEQRSIARALAARGYVVDPSPWGKRIAHVIVMNEAVFAEKNWLQFFNIFHWTTRAYRVRQELTIQAGEVWDQPRIEESARRLHDPLYSSVVALLPIKSATPGTVDLLVVTRDLWSLRLNSSFNGSGSLLQPSSFSLTNLSISLSENNFLGTRDVVAIGLTMDPGAIAIGPTFLDKDLFGKHLTLQVSASEIITRMADRVYVPSTGTLIPNPGDPRGIEDAGTLHSEGQAASLALSRPLWSLASKWGGGVSAAYSNQISRSFTGTHGDPFELFTDPGSGLPYEFRYRTWSVNANAIHQWGHAYKQIATLGYTVSDQKPSLLPSFSQYSPAAVAQFAADVFPRAELISEPYVSYQIFQPRYRVLRDVNTYDLAEDLQVGPSATATLAQGLRPLGGDATFTRPTVSAGWTVLLGEHGFIEPTGAISTRFQRGVADNWNTIDNSGDVALRFATPPFRTPRAGWFPALGFRLVGYSELDFEWHNTQNQFYSLGLDNGLRGYNIAEFRTPRDKNARRFLGQLELRMTPLALWVLRVGGVAFYEAGGVASTLGTLGIYNDVGVGLRVLVPQLNRDVFRVDVGFPLQSAQENPAGRPHVIVGFGSYF